MTRAPALKQENAWPSALVFDPAAAPASEIDSIFTANGPAPSVLLLAGRDARRGGWSAQAAIALADRCAKRGRCILIDLVIEGGELHDMLGADNTEGIADVFLFGASLRHVLQKPHGHHFEFVAAGAPSDTASVLEHARWARLLGEQERDGVTLLLYAAANAPGLEVLGRRIRTAVALAADQELASISSRVAEPVKKAVIAPPATA